MIDLQMLALALNLLSAARAVPTVIYHPGPGKTGTSAIQSAATRYRDCLATRDRVRYLGTFGLNAPGTRPGNRNPLDPVRYYALAGRGCGRSGDCPKYREDRHGNQTISTPFLDARRRGAQRNPSGQARPCSRPSGAGSPRGRRCLFPRRLPGRPCGRSCRTSGVFRTSRSS